MTWLVMGLLAAIADATKDLVSKKTMNSGGACVDDQPPASPYLVTWALLTVSAPFLIIAALIGPIPEIGDRFFLWVVTTTALYTSAVVLYMKAIKASDISITLPMIAFTPTFMLVTGPLILGELPGHIGIGGVLIIVIGAYLLNLQDVRQGVLKPFVALGRERGPRLMLVVALLFSITATTAKQAILESSPLFAMASMYSLAAVAISAFVFLTRKVTVKEVRRHWKGVMTIGLLMAISELGMAHALSMTLAVYAVSVKRLSILIGAIYGVIILKEKNVALRLIGATVMLAGVIAIAFQSAFDSTYGR